MSRSNVEIKARVADPAGVRARVEGLATERVGLDRQVDTYFATKQGRLKLRESSLSGAQLIPYLRPDAEGPRRSDYAVVPIDDPERVKALFAELLGVHRVVRKEREIWLVGNVRIHLDRVEELGHFLELEAVFDLEEGADVEAAEHRKLRELMAMLGVGPDDLIATSYEALLEAPAPE
ncbi:MAG: class IV adenylate cyclase [Myxococcales bacterium]|nr:class IV adenylate cyclase [Myxococcales bacterium]